MRQWMLAGCGLLAAISGCLRPGDQLRRRGDEIVAAGQLFHTGARVVLWTDVGGYDAYRCQCRFDPEKVMPRAPVSPDTPNRYSTRRHLPEAIEARVTDQGWTLADLQQVVDQFVIHYDVCGTSRQCFKILHDVRGLSVSFMLDADGTIYQTLDLKERAWHAGTANDRSVGVEIANIGAYRDTAVLERWYAVDAQGWPFLTVPSSMYETGIRTPGYVARPARKELIKGRINGSDLVQYDFTPEQYDAITKLSAALSRVLPKIRLDVPRDASGAIRPDVLSPEELNNYSGLLGHWHITRGKTDPGPAFDWERVLNGARRRAGVPL